MEFQLMLWKCCTQYASKFGKLNSSHRTGTGQFSFQSQRKAMPKNVQTTVQLCSFHMLVRLCSKSFKLGFSSIWTENFQMYKLGLEKSETRDQITNICCIIEKAREFQKNIYSASLTMLKPLTVWITTNWTILRWEYQTTLPVSWDTCMQVKKQQLEPDVEIKRCLFLGRKALRKLDSILKSRDITFWTKVQVVKAMVFPVAM